MDGAVVHDITFTGAGRRVAAFLVTPTSPPPYAGVLYLHWFSNQNGSLYEFRYEAIAMAQHGVASLLPSGLFPWTEPPGGVAHDQAQIDRQRVELSLAVDLLASWPGVDKNRLAFVGHDYGAMNGAVFIAAETRLRGAVLMTPHPRWVDWFATYFGAYSDPQQRKDYATAMLPYDPATRIHESRVPLLFQFARQDTFVSADDAKTMYDAAPSPKEQLFYDGDHTLRDSEADRSAWLLKLLANP